MAFAISTQLLEALVLSVCYTEDTYGYRITQNIKNAIDISESTLYPVLRRLQKEGKLTTYDKEYNGRNRRYYAITDDGKRQLSSYKSEWENHKKGIDSVLNGGVEHEKS
ncbi:MAG: PadR family transcriptional regulator [Ruminococcaceae bacterium]|nr:PadR family transcriptional regulator [Oscillospiraceae bacterium]